jgi:collagenase-like PrtC family protease
MEKNIELLAPGGDVDAIKAAIAAGADAVYCGLERFNARNRAANLSFAELQGILILTKITCSPITVPCTRCSTGITRMAT